MGEQVELLVARWGDSLAVRLSAECARRIGVREGDKLIAEVVAHGRLILTPEGGRIGRADIRRLREFVSRQPVSKSVIGRLRRGARS